LLSLDGEFEILVDVVLLLYAAVATGTKVSCVLVFGNSIDNPLCLESGSGLGMARSQVRGLRGIS